MTTETLHPRHTLRRNAAVAAQIVAWSGGFIGAEFGTRAGAPPFQVLSWRFILLSLLLLSVCAFTSTNVWSKESWKRQVPLALLSQVSYLGFVFVGVSHGVHGGTSSLIAALQPLLVLMVAGRLLGERRTWLTWVGSALGFLGVILVVSGDIALAHAPAWAYALPALAMLSLASGTILSRRIKPTETLLQTITIQAIVAAVAFTIAALITGDFTVPTNAGTYQAIAWLILVPSIAGYGLYVYLTHEVGATVVSTLLYLTPPTTMIWAYVAFDDPITPFGIVGLVVSAIGVGLVLRSRSTKAA